MVQLFFKSTHQLIEKCDAIFRIPGASKGADQDVEIARSKGLPVFYDIDEVPDASWSGTKYTPGIAFGQLVQVGESYL